jgi:Tfp pilus assembly protein PilO
MNSNILPALAFILALVLFFGYVNPTWTGSIATTAAAITADEQALTAAEQYSAQQNQLAAARDAIDPANLASLDAFLPSSVNNVGLILDLSTLATRSGILVGNIDVASGANSATPSATDSSAVNATVNSVDLSFSGSGTFSALQTFLNAIEKSQRLLDVHDLVIKGSDTGIYSYQMAIRLYWLH